MEQRDGTPDGDLRKQIEALRAERDAALAREAAMAATLAQRDGAYEERLAHQAATNDVLQAMSASPGDPQPVFELIAQRARDLCGAYGVSVYGFDGTLVHLRAFTGISDDPAVRGALAARYPMAPTHGWNAGRAILDRRIARIDDYETEPGLDPTLHGGTAKSSVTMPMMRGETVIGAIGMSNLQRGGFSDIQIELLKTFAEQAVIAITSAETYRALQNRTADLQESLEQQTATADVLKVISLSTFDLQPVFNTIVVTAARLCDASYANITTRVGDVFHGAAEVGLRPGEPTMSARVFTVDRETVTGRVALAKEVVQVADIAADPDYVLTEDARRSGVGTVLGVPLMNGEIVVGTLNLGRRTVRPFTDRQIELVRTFAAQAVIAMENARLITETHEALERQTATSEVLGVINASPGNLQPVFDVILDNAMRLCGVAFGNMYTWDGELVHNVAHRGLPAALAEWQASNQVRRPGASALQVINTKRSRTNLINIDGGSYQEGQPWVRALVDLGGARAVAIVPLIKDENVLGYFHFFRQEPRLFTDKQIALLENFAAQAVIAMENARLITETREALEQQTATAEVLGMINASPGNLAPVFDAILDKAHNLCGATVGSLMTFDGEYFQAVATHGFSSEHKARIRRPFRPTSRHQMLIDGARMVHIPDVRAMDVKPGEEVSRGIAEESGMRTLLALPLRKDGRLLGFISAFHAEVRPFSDREIALLENFAAQAVIAMENARLINETREALEQQTATAEVLGVINASPGNLTPVFQTLLDRALQLCGATFGEIGTFDGEFFTTAAVSGMPDAFSRLRVGVRQQPGPGTSSWLLRQGENTVQIADLKDTEPYHDGEPARRDLVDVGGARALLSVALRKDSALLGMIGIFRNTPGPFSDRQIALLENFAAQAVIAMENARLITETQEALEQQTATADVLQVINASPGDLKPVFDAMLDKAIRLSGSAFGTLSTFDGDFFRPVAMYGLTAEHADALQTPLRPVPGTASGRMLAGEDVVHVADIMASQAYRSGVGYVRAFVDQGGARTAVWVALRKDDKLLGRIVIFRREVRPFTDKQIALLKNFAAQAVIAMENARLITETREALEQQTATAEVLATINASPGNLTPVFDTILDKAMALCGIAFGTLTLWDGEFARIAARRGHAPAMDEYYAARPTWQLVPGGLPSRIIAAKRSMGFPDMRESDDYRNGIPIVRALVEQAGARTYMIVPLLKDDSVIGYFSTYRQEVRAFTDKEVALLESFAAQAAIAVENARLMTETREALEQQTATAEVLGVINASPGNLAPVFDAILDKAMLLCEATFGVLATYDGTRYHTGATHGVPAAFAEYRRHNPPDYGPGTGPARVLAGENPIHIVDMKAEDVYARGDPNRRAIVDLGGARTSLLVRLGTPDQVAGFIQIYRQEVRAFSDKQIALLQNFAAQAAIAMENARLMTETREARDAAEAALDDLRRTQDRLVQTEKMASLGQLTAGIAHEIKNPLNFVNNFSDLSADLLDELNEAVAPGKIELPEDTRAEIDEITETLKGNLQKIAQHGRRADSIVKNMLLHSRTGASERSSVELNAVAEEALNLAYHGARAETQGFNITLERDLDPAVGAIEMYPQEISRVLVNLINNGFYAAHKRAGQSPGFEPVLRLSTKNLGDQVEIRVRDNGTGIPAEVRAKIFEPFFTTKPAGEGTGLGLSLSHDIVVKQHGGTLSVDSEPGAFTEFVITVPRAGNAA